MTQAFNANLVQCSTLPNFSQKKTAITFDLTEIEKKQQHNVEFEKIR